MQPVSRWVRWLVAVGCMAAGTAHAADFQVEAETIGQGYQLRRYAEGGSVMLDRRRLTQSLRLHAFRLLPDRFTGPRGDRNRLYFTSSMRFDTDFGNYIRGAPDGSDRIAEIPRSGSLEQFQLLYAQVVGEDLFGFLDVQAGRQIVFDTMDFYAFDGLTLRAKLPWWIALEGSTGLEVRGESPLASPIYELDGTSVGSRDPATCLSLALGNPMRPCFNQNAALAPMVGLALESWGLQFFHGRLAYRRTSSSTAGGAPGLPSSGVNEEKISYTANLALGPLQPFGGFRYNLLVGRWDQLDAGLRLRSRSGHVLLAQYMFNSPTFDGDSIFNVFATHAINDLRTTYTTPEMGRWRSWVTGFVRFFGDNGDDLGAAGLAPVVPVTASKAGGLAVGTRCQLSRGLVRVDGYYDDGFGGRRVGGDVSGRYALVLDELDVEGRLTLLHFEPDLQTHNGQRATSFGLQAGVRYVLAEGVRLHLLVEENNNRYYAYQLRAIALLELSFWR